VLAWRLLTPKDPLAPLRRAATTSPTRPVEGWLAGFDHRPFAQPRSGPKKAIPIEVLAAADELQRARSDSPRALHARGIAKLFIGDPGLATLFLERAVAESPDNAAYWSDLAAAKIALGTASQSLGPFRQAVIAADRALAISPVLGAAHFNRATALEHLGDRDAAVRSYRAALPTSLPPLWRTEILARLD
jgi:tetratricopeptide (TPR) repeat protein